MDPKFFWPQIFFNPQFFWTTIVLNQNFFGPKICFTQHLIAATRAEGGLVHIEIPVRILAHKLFLMDGPEVYILQMEQVYFPKFFFAHATMET